MKRRIYIGLFSILLISSLFSCKKLIQAVFSGLEFNIPEMSLQVPAIPYVSPVEIQFGSITQHFNLDSIVKANTANAFGADIVKGVSIKSITISVSDGDDLNNLSNFQSARISLSSNANTNAVDIANIVFPTTNTNSFVYTPTNSPDLLSYIKGSQLTYTLYGQNRKITTHPLTFTVLVRLKLS